MPGQAGTISYPPYIQAFHGYMLGDGILDPPTDVTKQMDAVLLADNPHSGVAAVDPDIYLGEAAIRVTELGSEADFFDPQTTWDTYAETALAKAEDMVNSGVDLDADVDTFEEDSLPNLARSYNRMSAGFADINAVSSTAFIGGLSLLESAFNSDVSRYRASRKLEINRQKAAITLQGVSTMAQMYSIKLQSLQASAQLSEGHAIAEINAKNAQLMQDLNLTIDENFWEMAVLERGSAMIGAIGGVAAGPKPPTKLEQLTAGVANAASMALQIGTATGSPAAGLLTLIGGSLLTNAQVNQSQN